MVRTDKIAQLFQQSQPFFNALGDPVRQNLLHCMISGEILSVKELTARTKLSRPTVSHHLKILKKANIIVEQKQGRQIFYRPQPGKYFYYVKELLEIIDDTVTKQEGNNT